MHVLADTELTFFSMTCTISLYSSGSVSCHRRRTSSWPARMTSAYGHACAQLTCQAARPHSSCNQRKTGMKRGCILLLSMQTSNDSTLRLHHVACLHSLACCLRACSTGMVKGGLMLYPPSRRCTTLRLRTNSTTQQHTLTPLVSAVCHSGVARRSTST